MSNNKLNFISDHAVLRWVERVLGWDVEAAREEMANTPGLLEAADLGATRFKADGVEFVMAMRCPGAPMIVTTVYGLEPAGQRRAGKAERVPRFRRRAKAMSSSVDVKQRRTTLATHYEEDELAG